jgi:hypothetical protein
MFFTVLIPALSTILYNSRLIPVAMAFAILVPKLCAIRPYYSRLIAVAVLFVVLEPKLASICQYYSRLVVASMGHFSVVGVYVLYSIIYFDNDRQTSALSG